MIKNNPGLHIGFAGTPDLTVTILQTLLSSGSHSVSSVYTQADRPAGRGRKIHKSPVCEFAEAYGLRLRKPVNAAELEADGMLDEIDVLVVAAFGMILPKTVLLRPRYGCINVHTSLLPRWRGAAPIQRAILAGDTVTGITIIQMDAGLDTGDILYQKTCPLLPDDTAQTLHDRLAGLGAECTLTVLEMIINHTLHPRKQNEIGVCYAHKIQKSDAQINWLMPATEIERMVRAFNPAPIAYTELNGWMLRIWEATLIETTGDHPPGTIINYSARGIDVMAGDGAIRLLKLQLPGKKVMDSRDFFNGNPWFFG